MIDANTELLARMAEALGELREHLVFVGGCATALLITDAAAAPVRVTRDVDAIAAVTTYPGYLRLADALRARGFSQSMAGGEPPYRWMLAGMTLDLMPTSPEVLGFSNRWYEEAIRTAHAVQLREGLSIRLIDSASFVATKLEAFVDRGRGDFFHSHDLEDVLSVVDGRAELVDEMAKSTANLREFVCEVISRLLADDDFLNALPGIVLDGSPPMRARVVLDRLRAISSLASR